MDLRILVAIVAGIAVFWAALVALLWFLRPRDMRLGELVRIVPDIARLCRSMVGDAGVPMGVRLALVGLILWLVSPIDLVPEFVPVLGPLDDVVVAVLVLRYARRRVGEAGLRQRWRGTPDGYRLLRSIIG